jgi:ribosomal protein S12 methylthiotransferase
MNRHGDSKMIRELITKLRREIKDLTLRTTFIVGFPGETEEDFEELCRFVEDTRFEHLGVFPYSAEEGTPAADMPDQIEEQCKQDRADIVMKMQMQINAEQNEKKIGSVVRVLVEDFDAVSEAHFGRSAADAPEIDGKVYFKCERRVAPGSMIDVKVRDVVDYDLYGRGIFPRE